MEKEGGNTNTFAYYQGTSVSETKRAYAIVPEKRWRLEQTGQCKKDTRCSNKETSVRSLSTNMDNFVCVCVFEVPCIISLYYIKDQQDATLAVLFISHCKIALYASDAFCVHHQEY